MALPSRPGRKPQPSSTISTTGVRAARVWFILKGMQVSQVLRALPVVLGLAQRLSAQADVRVKAEGEWFYQEPDGKRLAQLPRGAVVIGGEARGDWLQVTLEGWVFGGSVGPTARPGFDLAVTRAPEENLRVVPLGTGALVARLNRGFALNKIGDSGRWVHVRREGWMKRDALEPAAAAAGSATASGADSFPRGLTLRRRPTPPPPRPGGSGPDTTASPAVDPSRAQPPRRTTLYRAPDGPAAGAPAPETPLRALGRPGEWTRGQFEGWGKTADPASAPPGVLVGVSAAELRAEPQRYVGQVVRWTLQVIALETADDLRPDLPDGTPYLLARGPLPERGFVYVIVPEAKKAAVAALAPLATVLVTARVRVGRARFIGNPVVEMLSLEAQP